MSNQRIKNREKCCNRCFAYIPFNSRRCQFCGCKFKSAQKHLFDRLKRALRIDGARAVEQRKLSGEQNKFLTLREVESLVNNRNFKIPMFLVLDDIAFLDDTALLQLGETLAAMSDG